MAVTGRTIAGRIIERHLVAGKPMRGEEIALRISQTLTQDATGTMAFLQFEALGVEKVRTRLSVSYVDHNTLQTGPRNADDHRYLETAAARYGVYFSRPGNGICHQVHLERFAVPGETLLGSDSHTPTCGGLGMLAIGAGGLDVAAAMCGEPFHLIMPQIILLSLRGRLRPWVSAKDIILELLRRYGVKWGSGRLLEYGGPSVRSLTVPERATIANMGTELGLTSSIFPSDAQTRAFLLSQRRVREWHMLESAGEDDYDDVIDIDLGSLEPLIAAPHSPGNVRRVSELEGMRVDQVCLGSCTNSSLKDMLTAAAMLRGRRIPPGVSLTVSPGSLQVLRMMERSGALGDMLAAGARILESACGPCIGMGQSPPSGGVSLRTFNRNFIGRSGTPDARVYLCSPEVAVASALKGRIADPRSLGRPPVIRAPRQFLVDDSMIIPPPSRRRGIRVIKGPSIKPLPRFRALPDRLEGELLLVCGDDVSTDEIMPAGARLLPLRSNVPALAAHAFERIDPSFALRARAAETGFVVAGENYGQGSSREHAAMIPRYLGVAAVIARSFARIHLANLVNFGVLPLVLEKAGDCHSLRKGDRVVIDGLRRAIRSGETVFLKNLSRRVDIHLKVALGERERSILLAGGFINLIRKKISG